MPAKGSRGKRSMANSFVAKFPPKYVSNPVFRRKIRYQAQATETKDQDYVTMGSLQNLQTYVGASTSGVGMWSAVKLNSVEMWADASANQTMVTIGIDWLSPDAPNMQITATGNAFTPAHFKVRPPKFSAASRWYAGQLLAQNTPTSLANTTPYAFGILNTVAGAIIEVDVSFTFFDYDTLNNNFATITGSGQANTPGMNAYLDNTSVSLGNGTKNWLVQGFANQVTSYVSGW
jgi:hypothetical protein